MKAMCHSKPTVPCPFVRALACMALLWAGASQAATPIQPGGEVVAWGDNSSGQNNVPVNLTDAVEVAAGGFHSLALRSNGTVVAWGGNTLGQANVPLNATNVLKIATGENHSLAMTVDGRVIGWGNNGSGQVVPPADLTNAVAIAAGNNHSLALKADGTVIRWGGQGGYGGEPVPSGLFGVVAIAAGADSSLALKGDGTVVAWGAYTAVPVGLNNVVAIAVGSGGPLAVKTDATLVKWGVGPAVPEGLSNIVAIAAGGGYFVALRQDKTVVSWGSRTYVPANLIGVSAISSGFSHSLAVVGAEVGVLIDGVRIFSDSVSARGLSHVSLIGSFANSTVLYTLDGSDPSSSGHLYEGPVIANKSSMLRAIAYNSDFSKSVQSAPVQIIILPTLSGITAGGGSVAIDPAAGAYFSNSTATVTATPAPGWTFLQWLGDADGTNATATVSVTGDSCVEAVFGTSLQTNIVGSGSILLHAAVPLYPFGATVKLTAIPKAGSYFAQWGTAAIGTNNPLSFPITSPTPTITAVFAALPVGQRSLTVIEDGAGRVTRTPPGNRFLNGTNITLLAVPDAGQEFLGWTGDTNGTANPVVVTMSTNKVITANFSKRPRLRVQPCFEGVTESGFRLRLIGDLGAAYGIEWSSNLVDWLPLATETNAFGAVQFTDTAATNTSQRFYRAVPMP